MEMSTVQQVLRELAPKTSWNRLELLFGEPQPLPEHAAPADYVSVLREWGPGEGFVGTTFLRLYPLDQTIAANQAYHVADYLPDAYLFGSTGTCYALLFDLSCSPPPVLRVPFVPLDPRYAEPTNKGFLDYVSSLGEIDDGYDGPIPRPSNPRTRGLELHEVHPVALGGDPMDPANRVFLPIDEHAQVCEYWNRLFQQVRANS
jgi:hypothetical protein